jgi:TfoX/Sxy family transcriptional regulator of competence genes
MAYNERLAQRMRSRMKTERGAVEKSMFGGIGFLVNGNMACRVNKQDLIVRLSEHDSEEALRRPHVRVFDMAGRPMKGWGMISSGGYASESALKSWIVKAMAHARSLPPK